ncbi:MAG: FGGY-family carbohydrate kinase [Pseudomonadota bacterium]
MALFLGIDFGTSGCRGCVIDSTGTVLAEARVSLPVPRRVGAAVEQDPALWWQALDDTLGRLRARIPLQAVTALCLDGTSATVLGIDGDGSPVTPALMYNDTRAGAAAARIRARTPAAHGAHGASASLAKALWLLEHAPDGTIRRFLHQADWLLGRLCGRFDTCDENNALKLGYDSRARRWPDWLDALGMPRTLLPRVVPAGTPLGNLQPQWCRRWGLPAATVVISGTTDSTASFIATGAGPGEAVTALGSTLVVKILAEQPVFAPQYGIYSHRLGEHWLAGGASNTGGAVLAQFFSRDEMERHSRALRPDQPTGLDYYPLPAAGERFPLCDPQLAPRLEPRPADDAVFFQAILEGIAAIEAAGYRRLAELGAPFPARVLTTGGGAVNTGWTRIRARLLGVPVSAAAHQEAAYGAALLALRAVA